MGSMYRRFILQLKKWFAFERIYQRCKRFARVLYRRIVLVLALVFCIGVGVALASMSSLSSSLIDAQALQSASLSANAINHARVLYSERAVSRARSVAGIQVTPEYMNYQGAIPNPATYTIELGLNISKQTPGRIVRLYSDFPFPHRQTTGGARDAFQREALVRLREHPNQPYFRKEMLDGRLAFRYAEAVLMEPSCVACHNAHPNSPRKDWRVGDVRGVLEVSQPLDDFVGITRNRLRGTFMMLSGLSVLAVAAIALVIARLRQTSQELEWKVAERTAELQRLAHLDGLTLVANRRRFDGYLYREWKQGQRDQLPLSLIICDVDHFKQYNDAYGHQAGDDCLRAVAKAIEATVRRPSDLVARYGGEEFAVILPNTPAAGALQVAEAIRDKVRQLYIVHEQSQTNQYVTLSSGITSCVPCRDCSLKDLIELADQALYVAKRQGRDRTILKRPEAHVTSDKTD